MYVYVHLVFMLFVIHTYIHTYIHGITNISLHSSIITYIQAPQEIVSLFSGSRQVIYGFVPHCLQVYTYTVHQYELS